MHLTLTNARIVLPDRVLPGTVHISGETIADIQPGDAAGIDMDGDFLIPGAVDLHTDNLERQVTPRQNARWPSRAAFLAHDSHCAAAGVTTALDALSVGHAGLGDDRPRTCVEGVADLSALAASGLLKAEHFLHLRCELPAENLLEQADRFIGHPRLRLVSLMDHTPGGGQFGDIARYLSQRVAEGETREIAEQQLRVLREQRDRHARPNRSGLLSRVAGRGVLLASHDDATAQDVEMCLADGIGICEFPVSMEAAQAARRGGMAVIGGAPNLVRGGSHSGNVAVAVLLAAGLVDALASDYVPASLVHAAFIAATMVGMDLPRAIGLITGAPARMAGFSDRGAITIGLRADLVRVRLHYGVPVIREVWRGGERVT